MFSFDQIFHFSSFLALGGLTYISINWLRRSWWSTQLSELRTNFDLNIIEKLLTTDSQYPHTSDWHFMLEPKHTTKVLARWGRLGICIYRLDVIAALDDDWVLWNKIVEGEETEQPLYYSYVRQQIFPFLDHINDLCWYGAGPLPPSLKRYIYLLFRSSYLPGCKFFSDENIIGILQAAILFREVRRRKLHHLLRVLQNDFGDRCPKVPPTFIKEYLSDFHRLYKRKMEKEKTLREKEEEEYDE